jgi:hypothetical protein
MTIELAVELAVKSAFADATPEQMQELIFEPYSEMVRIKELARAA